MKKLWFILLLVFGIGMVGCDFTTKRIAQQELKNQPPIGVVDGILDFSYTENRGVAFNVLRSIPDHIRFPLILTLRLLALPFIIFMWYKRREEHWSEHAAFALVIAGALGNAIDQISLGYVIDFIHIHYWPIFNVADICITCGAILLIIRMIRTGPPKEPEEAQPA